MGPDIWNVFHGISRENVPGNAHLGRYEGTIAIVIVAPTVFQVYVLRVKKYRIDTPYRALLPHSLRSCGAGNRGFQTHRSVGARVTIRPPTGIGSRQSRIRTAAGQGPHHQGLAAKLE